MTVAENGRLTPYSKRHILQKKTDSIKTYLRSHCSYGLFVL
jgi:hypothetical protein